MLLPTWHSALPLIRMLSPSLPNSLALFACILRVGRERLTGHFRDQRHEVIWAGLWAFFVPHLKTSHSSMWESKTTVLHSAGNIGLNNHVDRWRGTLLCLQRKTWYKKCFVVEYPWRSCRLPALPQLVCMWVMRTPVGMFSAWLRQHRTNVTWRGTIFNENR